jgi:biotin synthase
MDWSALSEKAMSGGEVSREDALAVLRAPDDALLELLAGAFAIRRRRFGNGVGLHVIRNARSGHCSEDCSYCSQSSSADGPIERYPLQTADQLLAGARRARELKAKRYCIVTSGRQPTAEVCDTICQAAGRIKAEMPLSICVSLGLLSLDQARRLRDAGVDRCNHNLETSERFYPRICTTHTWRERLATAQAVKAAGLELCSGGILGMGESLEDRVDLAFALKSVDADAVPVNFFDPRPGTPRAGRPRLPPLDALRALAMFRFLHTDREVRLAGGRELCLGPLQVLALYAADSMFTAGYLTTPGQGFEADMAMITAAGFHVVEVEECR